MRSPSPRPAATSPISRLPPLPVKDDQGNVTGYRINGTKQFISNGGYADFLTVLAVTPEGPSFFVVEKDMPGFSAGKPEEKHGIRASNTAALSFEDVLVPVENLLGDVPGQGLVQANEVFGYTRLMVGAMGLGAGCAALEKVIAYAKERVQFGSPLIEKQGYTHKLVVPFAARLEAARAYIEEMAARLDAGETDLQLEGFYRQALCHRDRQLLRRRRHPGSRWIRLYLRVRRREDQARRQDNHHLRRHQRDTAAHHRHPEMEVHRQLQGCRLRRDGAAHGRHPRRPLRPQGRRVRRSSSACSTGSSTKSTRPRPSASSTSCSGWPHLTAVAETGAALVTQGQPADGLDSGGRRVPCPLRSRQRRVWPHRRPSPSRASCSTAPVCGRRPKQTPSARPRTWTTRASRVRRPGWSPTWTLLRAKL